jgi:hypothetical protein
MSSLAVQTKKMSKRDRYSLMAAQVSLIVVDQMSSDI